MLAIDGAAYAQGRWGMALFLGRGFAAWMQAWTQATPDKDRVCSARVTVENESVSLPSNLQTQMVSALAGMVLDALRKEAA